MEAKKEKRGGWRGGGRPRRNHKKVLVSLDAEAYEILQRKENKSSFCESAIKHYERHISARIDEVDSLDE